MAKIHIGAVGSSSVIGKNNINVVFVNSFKDDKYHNNGSDDEDTSELDSKIDKIKHINKDPETYRNSLVVYNEYMTLLRDKYGGDELFRVALKHRMVTEKIPPKPEFKVNASNRDVWTIIQSGGEISKVKDLSISEEKERDYLERAGLLDTIDDVTIEAGEHPKELQKLMREECKFIESDERPSYIGSKSLNNFLDARYGNEMNSDGSLQFEVTLGDIWEKSDRYQKLEASRLEEEIRDVNIGTKWRRCSAEELSTVSAFETAGWDIDKLKTKFSEGVATDKKNDEKDNKRNKKHKKKRESKFSKLEIKTAKAQRHEDDIFSQFADFTSDYFKFGSNNVLMN